MRIRSSDVHEQTFSTTFRGFEPVEVDGFLNRVADELDRLAQEVETLEAEKAALQSQLDEEREARRVVESSMTQAEHLKIALMEKAKDEARVTLHQAKLVAERVVAEAEEEASTMRNDVERLRQKRIAFLAELSGISHGLAEWVAGIKNQPAEPMPTRPLVGEAQPDDPVIPDLSMPDPAVEFQVAKSQLGQPTITLAPDMVETQMDPPKAQESGAEPELEAQPETEVPSKVTPEPALELELVPEPETGQGPEAEPEQETAPATATFRIVTSEESEAAQDEKAAASEADEAGQSEEDEEADEAPAPDSIYKPIRRDTEEPV